MNYGGQLKSERPIVTVPMSQTIDSHNVRRLGT